MYWLLIDVDDTALHFHSERDMLREFTADPYKFSEAVFRSDTGATVYTISDLEALARADAQDIEDEKRADKANRMAVE